MKMEEERRNDWYIFIIITNIIITWEGIIYCKMRWISVWHSSARTPSLPPTNYLLKITDAYRLKWEGTKEREDGERSKKNNSKKREIIEVPMELIFFFFELVCAIVPFRSPLPNKQKKLSHHFILLIALYFML